MASLEEILICIQHPDQATRRAGEIRYHQLQSVPEYADIVSTFASDATKSPHLRHLAIVLMNQQVGRAWRDFNQSSKERIVQLAFNGCCAEVVIIRHSSMLLLSKIVSQMPLTESRDILSHLSSTLMAPDLFTMSWTLRCLCAVADEVNDDLLLEVVKHCYHRILELVSTLDPSNIQLLRYAAKLMRQCIQKFGNARMACGFEIDSMTVVEQFLASWTNAAVQWLKIHCCHRVDDIPIRLGVILELLRGITAALEAFPDECTTVFPEAMQMSWVLLCLLREPYFQQTLQLSSTARYDNHQFSGNGYSSDGDRIDMESLVRELFELMCVGLTSAGTTQAKELLSGNLERLATILSEYMQLTVEQREQWTTDGNEFVASEQEESSEFSIRQTGADLIREVCKNGKEEACRFILLDAKRELDRFVSESSSSSNNSIMSRILRFEGVMWSLGCMGMSYMKLLKYERRFNKRAAIAEANQGRDSSASMNAIVPKGKEIKAIAVINALPPSDVWQIVGSFVQLLLLEHTDDVSESLDMLRGRAIWMFGIYADLIQDDHTAIRAVSVSCLNLLSNSRPLAVRLQGCRALGKLLGMSAHCDTHHSKDQDQQREAVTLGGVIGNDHPSFGIQFGLATVEACLHLITEMTSSTVHFAMETITAAILAYQHTLDSTLSTAPSSSGARSGLIQSGHSFTGSSGHDNGSSVVDGDYERIRMLFTRVAMAGVQALSSFSTDPLLLDVSKDMLIALLALKSTVGIEAVFSTCAETFRCWMEHASKQHYGGRGGGSSGRHNHRIPHNRSVGQDYDDDDDEDDRQSSIAVPNNSTFDDNHSNSSSSHNNNGVQGCADVSPALIEVVIEILAKLACSPGVTRASSSSASSSHSHSHPSISSTVPIPSIPIATSDATMVLVTVEMLIASLRSNTFPCRRESIQALNVIFSHMDIHAVQSIFSSPFQTNSIALLSPSSHSHIANGYINSNPSLHMTNPHPNTTTTTAPATTIPSSPIITTNHVDTAKLFAMAMAEVLVSSVQNMEIDASVHGECSGPAAGLLCHLLLHFHTVLDPSIIHTLITAVLRCIRNAQSTYVRYSLLMGLVHLFARNAALLANPSSPLLSTIPGPNTGMTSPSSNSSNSSNSSSGSGSAGVGVIVRSMNGKKVVADVPAMGYILDQWCSLHGHLQTRYCGIISSLGLIELVKIFHQHTVNHGFALRVLRLILSTLPRLLLDSPEDAMEDDDGDVYGGMGGIRREVDGDELDFSEDDEDEFDSDYDVEEEWEEEDDEDMEEEIDGTAEGVVDGMGASQSAWNTKKTKTQSKAMKNVFAPAELYLSDMLDRNIGDENGSGKSLGAVLRRGGAGTAAYEGTNDGNDEEDDGYLADQENTLLVNVSNSLMFAPPSLDPLAHIDLQEHVIDLLMYLKRMNHNNGNNIESPSGPGSTDNLFPSWMGELSSPDQHLVQALVNSR